MGRRKSGRNVSGVILLNKPRDITSNAALQQVRRFFNANKAGHTGALDPLATGLLPLCFGEATKVSHFALEADKTYRVVAQLGARTTTSDAEGEVVERCQPEALERLTRDLIDKAIIQFTGSQEQSPSMYSALKYEGRPLYWYARQGIEVPRKTRTITIRAITFIDWSIESNQLTLEVTCSKGTYIRTLIDDMGQWLGCGAYVQELHRTWIEGVEGPVLSMDEIAAIAATTNPEEGDYTAVDALLQPNDCVIRQVPAVEIDAINAIRFTSGNPANLPEEPLNPDQPMRVFRASDGVFLGIGIWRDGALAPKRVVNLAD
ncbi:tRNA pseudouridine(55) synthase TruB [Pseudidiomarina gelatinasegens]|uniref:tRNA pseudouridine synthase B n=1 Tax=Pseudidiomarina gelatinasegens TaxID=2487740 RepID=A0A443Z752_9GAMM|nr:tRNA pseudouridine(55) synthase TruB [Pseudidiomarina gelatinasegens]RWU12757.1 tRNA pseudouridine(55) synthase TruB [Pseudidiomarina gelatinasegens]